MCLTTEYFRSDVSQDTIGGSFCGLSFKCLARPKSEVNSMFTFNKNVSTMYITMNYPATIWVIVKSAYIVDYHVQEGNLLFEVEFHEI